MPERPLLLGKSESGQEPRIRGFDGYDLGLHHVAKILRNGQRAAFQYDHYTAFRVKVRPEGDRYKVSVGIGWNAQSTSYSNLAPADHKALMWRFNLQADDAASIDRLLTDLGRVVRL